MPKFFRTKAIMLHSEAYASFLIIQQFCATQIEHGMLPDRLVKVYEKAQDRCARRWKIAYNNFD